MSISVAIVSIMNGDFAVAMLMQFFFRLGFITLLLCSSSLAVMAPVLALPPPEDTPEEVLRTQIILEARSPINGEPMSAREYAELEARLEAERRNVAIVPPNARNIINQLRLRRTIRTFFPFLLR
ncbi:MAG TPA: hypothetical protein V6D10_22855 [Trichocoleus sp.]|jgi:hypothetical protein